MNTSIPTEVPQDIEREMDIMFAQIEEMMANIRRNREEGEKIMAESHLIAQQNAHDLEELRQRVTRMK